MIVSDAMLASGIVISILSTFMIAFIDGNGRVLLPASLRELAGIEREVVAFSMAGWFELWDRDRWERTAFPAAVDGWTGTSASNGAEDAE